MEQKALKPWRPFKQTTHVEFPRQGLKARYIKACFEVDNLVLLIIAKR